MNCESCPCGAGGVSDCRVLKAFCVAMLNEPLGIAVITHREYECLCCGRVEKRHDRERLVLGWKRRSTDRCNCSELLFESFSQRD
jgi:hypothetical protein